MARGMPGNKSGVVKKQNGRRSPVSTVIALLVCGFWAIPSAVHGESESPRLFRIGTGGQTGVYYPIGKLIAKAITEAGGIPEYIGVAQHSAGSIANVRSLAAGEIEAGLVQADVAAWAFAGDHVFRGEPGVGAVRAVASLYPEYLQIVTRRDANIRSVADLRGKRISLDETGSGTLAAMRIVLDAHGMGETDLRPVYLKPVFTRDKMISGELQGFVMMAGAPMAAVVQVLDTGIAIVPVAPGVAAGIQARHPYLVPGVIPGGAYPGIPETPTVQVHALLVVNASMNPELVHRLTDVLWRATTLGMLVGGHPQGKAIRPETALTGISIPLHEGADRYYRQHPERFPSAGAE